MQKLFWKVVGAAMVFASSCAWGAVDTINLVASGDFEDNAMVDPQLVAWHGFGATGWDSGYGRVVVLPDGFRWGGNLVAFVAPGTPMSRDLATTAGRSYDLKFDLKTNEARPALSVSFGDKLIPSLDNIEASKGAWQTYVFKDLYATSSSTKLALDYKSGNDWIYIDNVSVVASPVPEPETYALILAGLGMVGFAARVKKKHAEA